MNVVCPDVDTPQLPSSYRARFVDRTLNDFTLARVESHRRLLQQIAVVFSS